jgi:hypothetical protein
MIINNLGWMDIDTDPTSKQFGNITYSAGNIDYVVTSSDGVKITGSLTYLAYVTFTAQGEPPYTAVISIASDPSHTATVEGITDQEISICYTHITPCASGTPGNCSQAYVFKKSE